MPEKKAAPTRRDFEEFVVKKAMTDDAFRNQLTTDPKRTLEKVLEEVAPGARLPHGLEVQVIQESHNTFSIVIPYAEPAGELSDAELERVAGGGVREPICVYTT